MKTIIIKGKEIPVPWRAADTIGAVEAEDAGDESAVCEVWEPHYIPLITAAPDTFAILKDLVAEVAAGNFDGEAFEAGRVHIEELQKA